MSAADERQIPVYDLRQKKPSLTLTTQSGVTQARWSRLDLGFVNEKYGFFTGWSIFKSRSFLPSFHTPPLSASSYILATSSAGRIRLWDMRSRTSILQLQASDTEQILSIDWSLVDADEFVSCSSDGAVLVWNTRASISEPVFSFSVPHAQHASYTPFGHGIATAAWHSGLPLHSTVISVWSCEQLAGDPTADAALSLHGCANFGWRSVRIAEDAAVPNTFYLVTRGETGLREQPVSTRVQLALGHDRPIVEHGGEATDTATAASASVAIPGSLPRSLPRNIFGEPSSRGAEGDPRLNLAAELNQARRLSVPGLTWVPHDTSTRSCEFTLRFGDDVVVVAVVFPPAYPAGVPPKFSLRFGRTSSQSSSLKQALTEVNFVAVDGRREATVTPESVSRFFVTGARVGCAAACSAAQAVFGSVHSASV